MGSLHGERRTGRRQVSRLDASVVPYPTSSLLTLFVEPTRTVSHSVIVTRSSLTFSSVPRGHQRPRLLVFLRLVELGCDLI